MRIKYFLCISFFYQINSWSASLETIQHRKKIFIGIATVYEFQNPLSFKNLNSGEYSGLEIQLITLLAQKIGAKLVIVPTKWDRFKEALKYGKIDAAIQQIFTPKNPHLSMDDVSYSAPYFTSSLAILCRKKEGCNIPHIRKYQNQIGSYNDPTNISYLKTAGFAEFKTYDLERRLFSAFFEGTINYMLYDHPLLSGLCEQKYGHNHRCKIVPIEETKFTYSIMVNKNEKSLLAIINNTIHTWMKDKKTLEIMKKINHE